VKTVQDLLEKQLVVGDTGPGTGTRSYPKALNDILGTKFRIVGVYPSSADVFLAMERGEVQGICESLNSIKRCADRTRKPYQRPRLAALAGNVGEACSMTVQGGGSGGLSSSLWAGNVWLPLQGRYGKPRSLA
jgi:hypothetical protein